VRGDLDAATRVIDARTIPSHRGLARRPVKVNVSAPSVGTEDTDDLTADLPQALDRAFADAPRAYPTLDADVRSAVR
jgi:hypothetical protein